MPVISAILITVVVLAVCLAGLSVALRGYFRAIPVSATVVAVCVLLLTGGSALAAIAAAMGVLIGVPVGLWVLSPSASTSGQAAFAHQHLPRRSADRAAVRQRWVSFNTGAGEEPTDTIGLSAAMRPGEPPPKGEGRSRATWRLVPRSSTAPQTPQRTRQAPQR